MQSAATVLDVLRDRGRRGLPCDELYRQLFNPHLYLLAYGRLYSNDGAMTPGADGETVDDMSLGKIGRIIDALRCGGGFAACPLGIPKIPPTGVCATADTQMITSSPDRKLRHSRSSNAWPSSCTMISSWNCRRKRR
jgi:hypothetical protein